jgi:hypothetical protein
MPSGKKRKRHKVATHKRKKERELTVTRRKVVLTTFLLSSLKSRISIQSSTINSLFTDYLKWSTAS